jgi:CheY-like chemotaxis protein
MSQTREFKVLLVEDEPADGYLVRKAFAASPFQVTLTHVTDGIEALEYLRHEGGQHANAVRPDLILLDLNMPRMDGRQLLAAIKKDDDLCGIPAIVLSTSQVPRDAAECYRLGAAGYVVKPMNLSQLFSEIRRLEDYWFSLVQLPAETDELPCR